MKILLEHPITEPPGKAGIYWVKSESDNPHWAIFNPGEGWMCPQTNERLTHWYERSELINDVIIVK